MHVMRYQRAPQPTLAASQQKYLLDELRKLEQVLASVVDAVTALEPVTGTATLVNGTVTVNNSKVTVDSKIFLTIQAPAGTVGSVHVSARTAGTSFTITSSSATDGSKVAYEIKP